MNAEIRITTAEEHDLPAIVDIYNSTVAGRMVTADLEPVTVESRVPWFRNRDWHTRPILVARSEEDVIGWMSFQPYYGRPAYRATAELSIYVASQCRGTGVGSMLLERAINSCGDLGIKTMLGFVFGHNEPSLRMLRKYGFQQWGLLPGACELDGIERDVVIMGRKA